MNIFQSPALPSLLKELSVLLPARVTEGRELALISLALRQNPLLYRLSSEQLSRLEHALEARLKRMLRPGDRLFQLDSREWLLLLAELPSRTIVTLAMLKLERMFAEELIEIDGSAIQVGICCGAVIAPEHGQDAVYLLQSARIACLEASAKNLPGLLYESSMEGLDEGFADIERDLRQAFRGRNALQLYLQPKINARSGRCDAAEALLRWQRAAGQWVPPPVITGHVQRLGLRREFNRWLFHRAALILSQLRDEGIVLTLSINLSISDLYDFEVPALIEQALATWHLPAASLCVEITETEMAEDSESEAEVFDVLHRLRELGVKLSIDDFGTGFSGMGRLKQTSVDEVKIDRSFVVDLLHSERDQKIAASIIELAHGLDISVTAEGVEEEDTIMRLFGMGCDYFQGFFFSPALPVEEFSAWVHEFHDAGEGAA